LSATQETVQELLNSVPLWWHTIEVAPGVVTPGFRKDPGMRALWEALQLPDVTGKTVLDINTWDGGYAFEAERRGAASVTALDYYIWAMDLLEHGKHRQECLQKHEPPLPYHKMPYWKPDELPSKRGFDVAHRLLQSHVKGLVADFMTMDLNTLGTFDVVLYLGSLYHMEDPFGALKRVAAVTREVAVVETEAVAVPGYEQYALCRFFESDELDGDVSNWWSPNEKALAGMCRAAGFSRVETIIGPPKPERPAPSKRSFFAWIQPGKSKKVIRYRAVVHAWK
jgi:tRNA (mo5U34)-methyltransferase